MNRPHASALLPLLLVAAAAHAFSGPNEPTLPAKSNAQFFEPAMQALRSQRLVFVPDPHGNQDIAGALAAFYKQVEIPENGGLTVMAEFMSPVHQAMMDRYLLGLEDIPPAELSQAWYDTADIGTWRRDDPDVQRIVSIIRERNRTLPESRRIRVVGGNEPVDWPQVRSLEDRTRTPPKNRYAIEVIDHLLTHCPAEKLIVQYGTYHVSKRFLPHFSRPDRPAFFYMGFVDPSNTCKRPSLSTFATVAEADACIGRDQLYAKTRDAVKAAYSNGSGVAFQFDIDLSKYLPDVPIPPDPELDRRRALLNGVEGEELEAMVKRNAKPQEMPACARR